MAAPVEIVNRALNKLGAAPITSLDDPSKQAKLAASMYELVRDAELAAHAWNFAIDRRMLPAESERPAFGWRYQHLLPAGCLRVLEAGPWPQALMDDYIGGDSRGYSLEGGRILSNHGPVLKLIYLRRVEDSGFYPPTFIEALAARLAMEMAEALTGSNSKRQMAREEYQLAVKLARRNNLVQRPPQKVQDDEWMLAHLAGRR